MKYYKEGLLIEGNIIKDNLRRYKIVVVSNQEEAEKYEKMGIVRVVEGDKNISFDSLEEKFKHHYRKWLEKWFSCTYGGVEITEVTKEGDTDVEIPFKPINTHKTLKICLLHHEEETGFKKEVLEYRKHGKFWTEVYMDTGEKEEKYFELLETILTSIIIVDNRCHEFVDEYLEKKICGKEKRQIFKEQLLLKILDEGKNKKEKEEILKNVAETIPKFGGKVHFLVIHLSFIEGLGYNEKEVSKFIKENLKKQGIKFEKLVITTGRGREWYSFLEEEHKRKVLFLPPESLINAMEYGKSINDDFDIKYGLIKLLFGS